MPASDLEFTPLHFGEKLRIVNPKGRLGIVTLWSETHFVERKLAELGVDLNPDTSKIAVIGNLYGNGLPHLLRNLLYNPQIRDLVICGSDRSGSAGELVSFFEKGIGEVQRWGDKITAIIGTLREIDPMVTPEHFRERPRIVQVGNLKTDASCAAMTSYIAAFAPQPPQTTSRVKVDLPEVEITHFPSVPHNHNIVKDKPLEAWRELIFRLVRFGRLVHLKKGDRQELLNVRAVILRPQEDSEEDLREFGFSLEDLHAYQSDMLIGELPEDQSYTYGNRIREYFGFDALERFAERLRENPEDRGCYLALWDSHRDVDAHDAPCLVSISFRVHRGGLSLTATYRTHNALDAWIRNVYGLMKVQEIVASKAGLGIWPLSVISHSISIDPSRYEVAQRVAKAKGFSVDIDPNGQFYIGIDGGKIVARHLSDRGEVLHVYASKKAERIQHELARDCAISDINHAMYIGRMLERAEKCLRTGEEFIES